MIWLYAALLGMAGLVPVGYVLYRRYSRSFPEMEGEFAAPSSPMRPPPSHTGQPLSADAAEGRGSGQQKGAVFSVEGSQARSSSGRAALTSEHSEGARICPKCDRRFPASMVVCPHDANPLRAVNSRQARHGDGARETRHRRCPGCGRRYAPGAQFCYHDGTRLVGDSVEQADEAPHFKMCVQCGWEGQTDEPLCPRDGAELTLVDPSREGRQGPAIPVLVCPECGAHGGPGQAICPEDGEVMTPLSYPHLRALPVDAAGPRRKICKECGHRYGGAAEYCSQDGHHLTALN